jgi:cation-transporting ATPase 13A2
MYSVILWAFEAYWYYAGAIVVIAAVSIVQSLRETRRRMTEMAALARWDAPVCVWRDGAYVTISSTRLVPGDIVKIETGVLPCDLSLLEGGCVVNESMLTGESVPCVKVGVQWPVNRKGDAIMPLTADPRHVLYAATKVMQLKPTQPNAPVLAIVVRTGFATTKGALLLSILYPQPSTFQFVTQSYRFIGALFALAMVGFGVSVWQLLDVQHASSSTIVIRALDLITIVVPPSLPLALTVGTNFAIMWLQKEKIFCISPARITMAGKVKLCCFDKTGTLTEESLEFSGVYGADALPDEEPLAAEGKEAVMREDGSVRFGKFQSPRARIAQLSVSQPEHSNSASQHSGYVVAEHGNYQDELDADAATEAEASEAAASGMPNTSVMVPLTPALKVSLACCQSLAVMDGELIGDPLEQQTFDAAGATLQDTGDLQGYQQLIRVQLNLQRCINMGIVAQFEFSSALQRMSVLCTDMDTGAHYAFVKGSPEMMQTLCTPSSLPPDYKTTLGHFARKGFRVIAIGRKRMATIPKGIEKTDLRVQVEQGLTFLGLVLLENKLKPETEPTLAILRKALVRCIMITGDNPLTAVTVAKECKLVEPGTRIFQSTLVADSNASNGFHIEWHDTDDETLRLDPMSLRIPPQILREWKGTRPIKYELALTGPAFKFLQDADGSQEPDSYFHRALLNTQIAARFSPDQKASLVAELQGMGIYCAMCGDGSVHTCTRWVFLLQLLQCRLLTFVFE